MPDPFFDLSGALPRGPVSPGAILDFHVDLTQWLGADPVLSITWTLPSGLTLVTQSYATGVATAWISGFVADAAYEIACTVVTDTSPQRRDTRYFVLNCKKR